VHRGAVSPLRFRLSLSAAGPGYHVARFAQARRGLLAEAELADVFEAADVIANDTIVRDGTP
jgi:hypothetical protein